MEISQAEGLQRLAHSLRGHFRGKKPLASCQVVYNPLMSASKTPSRRKKGKAPVANKPMPSDPAELAMAMFMQADRKIRKKKRK